MKVPVKLTLTVFSNQSRSTGPVRPTTAAPGPMPAQFTKILAVPWASLAKLIAFEALSGSLTSPSMASPLIFFALSLAILFGSINQKRFGENSLYILSAFLPL